MKPRLIIGNKNYSSWSLRAWFLMREAGIDFDEHRIQLDTDRRTPAGRLPSSRRRAACRFCMLDGHHCVGLDGDRRDACRAMAGQEPVAHGFRRHRAHARSHQRRDAFRIPGVLRKQMPLNCRAMGRKVPLAGRADRCGHRPRHRHLVGLPSKYGRHGGVAIWRVFASPMPCMRRSCCDFEPTASILPESAGYYPHRVLERARDAGLARARCEVRNRSHRT